MSHIFVIWLFLSSFVPPTSGVISDRGNTRTSDTPRFLFILVGHFLQPVPDNSLMRVTSQPNKTSFGTPHIDRMDSYGLCDVLYMMDCNSSVTPSASDIPKLLAGATSTTRDSTVSASRPPWSDPRRVLGSAGVLPGSWRKFEVLVGRGGHNPGGDGRPYQEG